MNFQLRSRSLDLGEKLKGLSRTVLAAATPQPVLVENAAACG
jgi:hypothetical protein